MNIRIVVEGGDYVPRGYGRAYFLPSEVSAVCYLVPFHWIVRWARNAWFWFLFPRRVSVAERLVAAHAEALRAYERGYRRGFADAMDEGMQKFLEPWRALGKSL